MFKFKEATRGLGACCSWQGIIAKIGAVQGDGFKACVPDLPGVAKMRQLCMLAEGRGRV